MIITNPRRKKQLKEFIDNDHFVAGEFYELMDSGFSEKRIYSEMKKLTKKDEDFYDPHLVIVEILFANGKSKEGEKILKEIYEKAVRKIADYKGRWPKEMIWGFLENRHLMRVIEQYGILCWENNNTEEALNIFRRLLHANPRDNQGARYNILAINMGLDFDEWQEPFIAKHNGKIVGLNAIKVSSWFKKNAKKFPEDFDWLIKLYKKWDEEE